MTRMAQQTIEHLRNIAEAHKGTLRASHDAAAQVAAERMKAAQDAATLAREGKK